MGESKTVTPEEVQAFQAAGREFIKAHPDFNEVLQGAEKRKLNLSAAHTAEIVRLRAPEVAYWLAKPENEAEARAINVADGERVNSDRAADKIRRLHSRLARNQTFQTVGQKQGEEREVSDYLAKRREDFRNGNRRRR